MLTQYRLKELLTYNENDGIFIFKKPRKKSLIGRHAGRKHKTRGYREIYVGGKLYYAHRLAWLYMTGDWPDGIIDHINHNKDDNSFKNLRDSNFIKNGQNRKSAQSNNKLQVLGVSKNGKGYRARLFQDGKEVHLGTFETVDLAKQAHMHALKRLRGVNCKYQS